MSDEIIHHYPPELLQLLVDTIPLLCRSKDDVLIFFKGAGVPAVITAEMRKKVATDRANVNKFAIARDVLVRLNDKGESTLRERREILKRVTEFEDFSTCWPTDQLKAKGLVADIRHVVKVKDSFSRMNLEREEEQRKRREEESKKLAVQNERKARREKVKLELFALFGISDPQTRGKRLETVLNSLFTAEGIAVREAFTRVGNEGEGIVEQIDGVIELDGEVYLVEMKWWEKPLGTAEVTQHLFRVFKRHCARGLLISYSGYSEPAVTACRDALSRMVVALATLQEIVRLLEGDGSLSDLLKRKVQAAIIDQNPLHSISG